VGIEEQGIEKEKKRREQRNAKVLRKPVENQEQEVARKGIESHEEKAGKAKQMRKPDNILSKRRVLKIAESRRSKIRNISSAARYVNSFITIVREMRDINR